MKSIIMALVMVIMSSISYAGGDTYPLEGLEYTPRDVIDSLKAGYGYVEDTGATNGRGERLYTPTNFVSGIVASHGIPIVWCGEYTINFSEIKLSNDLHKIIRGMIDESLLKSEIISKNDFNIFRFNQNLLQNTISVKRDVMNRFMKVAPKGVTLQRFELISLGFDGEAL